MTPKRKGFSLRASSSKKCDACRLHCPYRGVAAFSSATRFDLLLLSAAALPVLWQCGLITVYRCTHQCGERSKAAFGTQSTAVLPSFAPHDSKARLISVTTCRRFMAKPCTPHPHCAARAVLQATDCQCAGSRGKAPRLSLGGVRGIFSFEKENIPLCRVPTRCGARSSAAALHLLCPTGAKRNSPRGLLSSRARGAKVVQIVNMGYLSPFPLFFLWIICSIDFWRFRG